MHSVLLTVLAAAATVCATAKRECTEWITTKGDSSKLLIYRSYALGARNDRVTRALVFVHGINRDADNHFRTALAAAFLDGVLTDTVIVAPRFASNSLAPGNEAGQCIDHMSPDEANWFCDNQRRDTWRSGGPEVGNAGLASFDLMDEVEERGREG